MIYKPRNVPSSPTVFSIRSFAAWFSFKLLCPTGQSVNKKSERRSSAGNEPSSSILRVPTSAAQSLKRHAKSFSKKMKSLSSDNEKGVAMTPSNSPPRICGSLRAESSAYGSSSSSSEDSDEEVRVLSEVFTYFDADGDGKISMAELTGVLNSLGVETSEREVRAMMEAVDSDGDGYIDLHDFIRLNTKTVRGTPQAEDELLEAFRLLDTEKGGSITPSGLREMMWRLLGEERTLDECAHMIKHFDLDGDGVVSFHEFKHMMTAPY